MIPQLESMIKQKMTPTLVDRVDFSTEGEIFVDLVAHTLKVMEIRNGTSVAQNLHY